MTKPFEISRELVWKAYQRVGYPADLFFTRLNRLVQCVAPLFFIVPTVLGRYQLFL